MTTSLKFKTFATFTGGLKTNKPTSELDEKSSPDLDNIFLLDKGFNKRNGDSEFNGTAMNSGANVQGLTYFKNTAGTEYLVTVCGDKVYSSDSLDGTMDDITGALTITAGQNNIWTFAALNNLCIGVGGTPNAPFKYSGTGNAVVLGGSPVSGKFCFQAKDRIFIGAPTANPSTIYWSILSNPEDWSGVGSGNSTIETNDGDTLVAGIPLNNDVVILFKNYSIHTLNVGQYPFPSKLLTKDIGACGKNAIVNTGGEIFFITNEPRMKSTDGFQVNDYPDDIDDIWDGISKSRLPYIQGIYHPKYELIHWILSNGSSSTNNLDIIWDLRHNCWLRNTTGFDCNVVCLGQGYRLFGGHTNGKIYEKYKANINTDASESSSAVNGYWYSGWLNDGNNESIKQIRSLTINYTSQLSGNIHYSYGYNYSPDTQSGDIDQTAIGDKWDVGLWGNAVWGGQSDWQKRVFTYSRGNNFQYKISSVENVATQINSITLALAIQGTKELTNS